MTKRPYFPRLPLLGVFALIAFTIVAAFIGRATHAGAYVPAATLIAERDLLFFDRADGAVVVQSPRDHHIVQVFQGEQGFLRGTMRGFARNRRLAGFGPNIPFRLARWSDGRITIDDSATGEHVELNAFGPTNVGVFEPLLDENRAAPEARS